MISFDDFEKFDEEEQEEAENDLCSKTLDIEYVFSFSSVESGYDYDVAELSEGLYNAIKKYYLEFGEDEINLMLEDEDFPEEFKPELQEMFDTLKDNLIEMHQETDEEYDWNEADIRIIVEAPEEWEDDDE